MAQDYNLSKKNIDSINQIVENAFELNHKSEYNKSITIVNSLLPLIKNTNNYKTLGDAYTSLSYSYSEIKEKEKAFKYSFLARDNFIKAKDTTKIILVNNNIGVIYRDFKMFDEANSYFKKALNLGEIYKKNAPILYPSFNIGLNLIRYKEEYANGLIYLQKAIKNADTLGFDKNKAIYGEIYTTMAYAYYKLGNVKASTQYYDKAMQLAKTNKYLNIIQSIYLDKAEIFSTAGNYERAYNILVKNNEIHDSISKISNLELTRTIEAKYKVIENEKSLNYLLKEQAIQNAQFKTFKRFMAVLGVLTVLLFITIYWIVKKNKQLQIAKDVAENLSNVKSEFYSEISHELRTPLYAVIQLSNLLLTENVNKNHREYLESLKFSGNHLLALVNNILELNKSDVETVTINPQNFNLKNLITNTIDSTEFALVDSNNSISLDYDDAIPQLLIGDPLKLSQVFINLISNAIKFTNNGTIVIGAKSVKDDIDQVKILFFVKDSGVGISKEKQSQVFENFYQEHAKIEKSYRGTGLGLSIVNRIVKAMGSQIYLESAKNKGSKFYFEIVFSKMTTQERPVKNYQQQLDSIKGKRILIVDDNKINLLVTHKVLNQLQMESTSVNSGLKAIQCVKNKHFDCVLMDLHMPDLDGCATTKIIRTFNKKVPIVALSAAASEEVKVKVNKFNMDGYILKPFIIENFVEVINNAIQIKRTP